MIPDWLSARLRRPRVRSGASLTLLLIAVSILGGIVLAIACSYRPIALWWVMAGCSAINVVRFVARLPRHSRTGRPGLSDKYPRAAAAVTRAAARVRAAL